MACRLRNKTHYPQNNIYSRYTPFQKRRHTACAMLYLHIYWIYISFYPYTDEVKNLRLSGLKYELEGVDVIKGSSRTVSNEFAEGIDKAYVSFDSGILTVIQSKDK